MTELLWLVAGMTIGVGLTTVVAGRRYRAARHPAPSTARTGDLEPTSPRQPGVAAITDAELLTTVIEAMPTGVLIVDGNGNELHRNEAMRQLGSDSQAQFLIAATANHLVRSALRGTARSQRLDLFGPPARVITISAAPIGRHGQAGAVIIADDVTERSRLDAVRTDFVANISHELKTPIGALAVLCETLVGETDPAISRRLAAKTVDEAHRVSHIVDDLLELSLIELGQAHDPTDVRVAALIDSAVARSRYLAEQVGVEVRVEDGAAVETVPADQRQLESALGNLVDNAVKYSDSGGVVVIRTSCDDEQLVFEVIDSGIGIPAADLERVFERFYRVDRGRGRGTGGTGLGLSIVRHIANNHGGSVSVDSRLGQGSSFRLSLPLREQRSGVSV